MHTAGVAYMSCWFSTIAEHGANYTKESLLQSERRATWPTIILDGTARIEFVQPENLGRIYLCPGTICEGGNGSIVQNL